jgi:hypothetical protein
MQGQTWDISGLPADVAAKVAVLGKPLAVFSVGGRRLALELLMATVMLLVGLTLMALPLLTFFVGPRMGAGLVKLLIVGCVLAPASVIVAVRAFRTWGLRVLVFPEGLVRYHRGQVATFFWDEIDTVWRKKNTGHLATATKTTLVFTVRLAGGEEFHFDEYLPDLKRLGALIQRESLRHLLPRALEAYHLGETVRFGKMGVSREGLNNGSDTLPWSEVRGLKIDEDKLTISKEGKWLAWHSASVSDIPNSHVFQALVQQILDDKVPEGTRRGEA